MNDVTKLFSEENRVALKKSENWIQKRNWEKGHHHSDTSFGVKSSLFGLFSFFLISVFLFYFGVLCMSAWN